MMVPQNGWFIMENPIYKWMMTGGTPMTMGKPPFKCYSETLSMVDIIVGKSM